MQEQTPLAMLAATCVNMQHSINLLIPTFPQFKPRFESINLSCNGVLNYIQELNSRQNEAYSERVKNDLNHFILHYSTLINDIDILRSYASLLDELLKAIGVLYQAVIRVYKEILPIRMEQQFYINQHLDYIGSLNNVILKLYNDQHTAKIQQKNSINFYKAYIESATNLIHHIKSFMSYIHTTVSSDTPWKHEKYTEELFNPTKKFISSFLNSDYEDIIRIRNFNHFFSDKQTQHNEYSSQHSKEIPRGISLNTYVSLNKQLGSTTSNHNPVDLSLTPTVSIVNKSAPVTSKQIIYLMPEDDVQQTNSNAQRR